MEDKDCKEGAVVRITQPTRDRGRTGKILNVALPDKPIYYKIDGMYHHYTAEQIELVKPGEVAIINNYSIY